MTPDDAIHEFANAGKLLPSDAMRWALDHWSEAAPRFLRVLDDYVEGRDRSDAAAGALFLILHLAGAAGEHRVFPGLCRLLHDGEACRDVLGDAITETLRSIVIGSFDGDIARLTAVIDDPSTDDFVRDSLLIAMAYLTRTGRVSKHETREYLAALIDRLDPEIEEPVVAGWVTAVAMLGLDDFVPLVEALFQRAGMEYSVVTLEEFREQLRETLTELDGMAAFEREHAVPFTDVITELSGWAGFSGEVADADDEISEDDLLSWAAHDQPFINPFRHVGRNDPCPCGSGKKFKKCCLNGAQSP